MQQEIEKETHHDQASGLKGRFVSSVDVIWALMLHDIKNRFFGSGIGQIVMIIWPFAHILLLITIYTVLKRPNPYGESIIQYYAVNIHTVSVNRNCKHMVIYAWKWHPSYLPSTWCLLSKTWRSYLFSLFTVVNYFGIKALLVFIFLSTYFIYALDRTNLYLENLQYKLIVN